MIHAVVGSRDYPRLDLVQAYVEHLPDGDTVVSGGARGVDWEAEKTAKLTGRLWVISWRVINRQDGWFGVERWQFDPTGAPTKGSPKSPTMNGGRPWVVRQFGGAAYFRNGMIVGELVADEDDLMAFWDGESPGTKDSIARAQKQGSPLLVIGPDGCVMDL